MNLKTSVVFNEKVTWEIHLPDREVRGVICCQPVTINISQKLADHDCVFLFAFLFAYVSWPVSAQPTFLLIAHSDIALIMIFLS